MNESELLAAILPEHGPYLLALPAQFTDDKGEVVKYFRHIKHESVAELIGDAQRRAGSLDVYFALGTVVDPDQKKLRKAGNIARLRAFWLDIDVKDDDRHYGSKGEAAKALKAFLRAYNLPDPCIVDSGGGLHVYWPLTKSVDKDQWVHYAGILKQATKTWGLKVDMSRTSDCASVLRVPGTLNHKYGDPVAVSVALSRKPVDPTQFMTALAAIDLPEATGPRVSIQEMPLGTVPEHLSKGGSEVNKEAAGGVGNAYTQADPRETVRKCQQLTWQAGHPEEVEEPQWYDMVGCLRHAKRGEEAVHAMSRGYSKYSKDETNKKIRQHIEQGVGPTLCSTFDEHNPGRCEGCPYVGKISTPLQLGQELAKAEAPVRIQTLDNPEVGGAPLPDPPFPFKRVTAADGKTARIAIKHVGDEGVEFEEVIYEHDVYPQAIIYDEREGRYVVEICRWLPKDGWEMFPVPLGQLYDKRKLSTTLGDIGVLPDLGKVDLLVQYMLGYIRELQKTSAASTVYAQLGWRDNGKFVLGDKVIENDKVTPVNVHSNVANALQWETPRGDINEWRKVVAMYERPGLEAFQFGIGVGFAAPLFRFTNYNGMIVSLVGAKGSGKSSVLHVVNSIWNHKEHNWADIQNDSIKAFYNKLGVLKNLPACYDEITNLDEQDLSDLCYAVSKGQGRQRLNQDGSAKANHGSWQTMVLTTSNSSLHSRLSLAKADASAEAVRVFEYYIPGGRIKKSTADETLDLLNDNFGLAGEMFVREAIKDVSAIRDRIKYWTRYFENNAGVTSGERFWAAAPACVLTALEITNRIGLTNTDIDALVNFAAGAIQNMRDAVVDNTRTPVTILGDFLNSNLDKMLTFNVEPVDGKMAYATQEPRNELRIRYEAWRGVAYVDRAHFRQYCADRHIDVNRLKHSLKKRGILKEEKRMVLGRGTQWKTAQVWTWEFNMNHPDLGNVAGSAASAADVANEAIASAQKE